MRIILVFILFLHGLIHLMGFAKAFQLAQIEELTMPISKTTGLFWLLTCLAMLASGTALLIKANWWWILALAAIVISQVLIIMSWQDAKYGTIANLAILILILISYR